MEQWEVKRGSGLCAGTGSKFGPGQEYYAALIDIEGGFERRDYSIEYWDGHELKVYSFWKTRVPLANQKKKLFVDDDVLINFFERLAGEEEQIKVNFRFVLALILMRKRILKYEDSHREDDKEIWQMRLVRETKIREVINPKLDNEQIEQVSQELSSILQGEL